MESSINVLNNIIKCIVVKKNIIVCYLFKDVKYDYKSALNLTL